MLGVWVGEGWGVVVREAARRKGRVEWRWGGSMAGLFEVRVFFSFFFYLNRE